MMPEAAEHIEKARQCLARARTIFTAEVPDVAAREAYLAAFHAAQGLIAERTGRNAKTHKGVHVQFARLTKNEPQIDRELRQFLPKAYDMKSIADYGVEREIGVSSEQAGAAIETATRFVDCIATLLAQS
jgi:uncharacterized protein (UPF0332 family)